MCKADSLPINVSVQSATAETTGCCVATLKLHLLADQTLRALTMLMLNITTAFKTKNERPQQFQDITYPYQYGYSISLGSLDPDDSDEDN